MTFFERKYSKKKKRKKNKLWTMKIIIIRIKNIIKAAGTVTRYFRKIKFSWSLIDKKNFGLI